MASAPQGRRIATTVVSTSRRRWLARGVALGAAAALPFGARAGKGTSARVVVVGGGWGGLSAARALRTQAPDLDVTLIERSPQLVSLPLSTRVLAGTVPAQRLAIDAGAAAQRLGYHRVQAEVTDIDRAGRRVHAGGSAFDYDWLVLAPGIRYDYAAWFGDDQGAARQCAARFPCGFRADDLAGFAQVVEQFSGGDLLMNLPPSPGRCPPAPYERAVMIAQRIRTRGIKGRLILLDPGPGTLGFRQVFDERYRNEIVHVTHADIRQVDLATRTVRTEFDEFRFDAAVLAPPQQAGELVWRAGLAGRTADGRPGGWADQHPTRLSASADDRVFLVGDCLGAVSPLFGHYTKSAHVAVRLGQIAAANIVAAVRGVAAAPTLPDSVCFVRGDEAPAESLRIEATYRLRGDGVIAQSVTQHRDPQPRDEDLAWFDTLVAQVV